MSTSRHFEKFKDALVDGLGVKPEWAVPESQLGQDMMLDSLDREELSMTVEEVFELRIKSDDLRKLCQATATMQDWLDYLDKHV